MQECYTNIWDKYAALNDPLCRSFRVLLNKRGEFAKNCHQYIKNIFAGLCVYSSHITPIIHYYYNESVDWVRSTGCMLFYWSWAENFIASSKRIPFIYLVWVHYNQFIIFWNFIWNGLVLVHVQIISFLIMVNDEWPVWKSRFRIFVIDKIYCSSNLNLWIYILYIEGFHKIFETRSKTIFHSRPRDIQITTAKKVETFFLFLFSQ